MTSPVIAWQVNARYHRHNPTEARAMGDATAGEIEQRLNDGDWLKPGEVATLFGKSRWAVDNWLKKGVRIKGERYWIGYRETPGGHRECDPADIAKILAAYRVRRTAGPPTDG